MCSTARDLQAGCGKAGKEHDGAKGGFWSIKRLCERAALFTGVSSLSCDCGILPFSSDGFHFIALKEINKLRVMLF